MICYGKSNFIERAVQPVYVPPAAPERPDGPPAPAAMPSRSAAAAAPAPARRAKQSSAGKKAAGLRAGQPAASERPAAAKLEPKPMPRPSAACLGSVELVSDLVPVPVLRGFAR